jgi:hypothetical protein
MRQKTDRATGDRPNWPAHKVELWPIERLKPYGRNARRHSAEQIEQLRASIREYGWTMPVLIREDGTIIAGHGRTEAAKLEGIAEAPVIVARGWTEAQCRAYAIADNRLTENSEWDKELLALELGELEEAGFNLALTGFDNDDLEKLLAQASAETDEESHAGKLKDRFGVPPFSVLNAREGWWQDRKRAWLSLGIKSELGRGAPIGGAPLPMDRAGKMGGTPEPVGGDMLARARENFARKANATPGGSAMPAADYSKTKARGDGRGRAVSH